VNDFFGLSDAWLSFLSAEFEKPYLKTLQKNILTAFAQQTIYPKKEKVMHAFNCCLPADVKLIIIGQDPYHGNNQANGLSFSVNKHQKIPPSLKNIFKELQSDLPDFTMPTHGNLNSWATQGVLLLNTVLTVKAQEAGSHKNMGWELFTDAVIETLSREKKHMVFFLWGKQAIEKVPLIDASKHLILTAAHPSPLARGAFFGCKHFSKANAYFRESNQTPIDWRLPEEDLFSGLGAS
jgi:uracil-DNA glycosylase